MDKLISIRSSMLLKRMVCLAFVLASSMFALAESAKPIPAGARVYVAPMNGFETYLIAALDKKKVPVVVVADRDKADFEITGASESEKAGWAKIMFSHSTQSTEQASINVHNIKTGAVVFAYAVNKSNSVHGKQSTAEACAKH